MKKIKKVKRPTDSEMEILQILWSSPKSTVREVNDRLNRQRDVGYTTTLKIMQIMHEKGLVSRDEKKRSHLYTASVSEEIIKKSIIDKIVDSTFKGSAQEMILHLLDQHDASEDELEEIKKLITQIEKNTKS